MRARRHILAGLMDAIPPFETFGLEGCLFWSAWDLRDQQPLNSPIAEWVDQIQGLSLLQTDVAKRPTLTNAHGQPGACFDGSDDWMLSEAYTAIPQPYTRIVICNTHAATFTDSIVYGYLSAEECNITWDATQWSIDNGTPVATGDDLDDLPGLLLLTTVADGADTDAYRGTTQLLDGVDAGSEGHGRFALGATNVGTGNASLDVFGYAVWPADLRATSQLDDAEALMAAIFGATL